jgi:polyhydroxybutyrate depolymerase
MGAVVVSAALMVAGATAAVAVGSGGPSTPRRPAPTSVSAGLVVTSSGPAHSRPGPANAGRTPPAVGPVAGPLTPSRLLAGVGPMPARWSASVHTLPIGGLSRTYLTLQPAESEGPLPVVVLLPGRNMSPDGILHVTGLARGLGPAVLVVPESWHEFWNAGDCCGAAYLEHIDDVGFIQAAVRAVLAVTPDASSQRVFAVGFSNGGRLAYHLACDLPGVFSGVMAVEAVPVQACPAMHPLDISIVAQQADPLLTVEAGGRPKTVGGLVEPTVAATVAHMAALDGCRATSAVTTSGRAVEHTWSCAAGTHVRYVWYPGGAHTWRPPAAGTPGASDFVDQLLGTDARQAGQP